MLLSENYQVHCSKISSSSTKTQAHLSHLSLKRLAMHIHNRSQNFSLYVELTICTILVKIKSGYTEQQTKILCCKNFSLYQVNPNGLLNDKVPLQFDLMTCLSGQDLPNINSFTSLPKPNTKTIPNQAKPRKFTK